MASGALAEPQHTAALYAQFVDHYQLDMSQQRFVGLCAYLHVLLMKGFAMKLEELDRFICSYSGYELHLPGLEEDQMQVNASTIPSYHDRFRDDDSLNQRPLFLLTEQSLRQVWDEHPHTFLDARASLDHIAKERRSWALA